jgi:protein-L-isoaspartate(D-aspartate) O-methyltransferase
MDLEKQRQFYAEELRAVANIQSEELVHAFAKVPREHFLGPGPWQIVAPSEPGCFSYRTTEDTDPRHLYHNVLVAIDAERHLNNGQPSGLALWFDALELHEGDRVVHVGCGTGYYSAILAEVVGPNGQVIAIDVDPELASRARNNLSYLSHVQVLAGDGGEIELGPSDAIFINAGATHPGQIWLDSLRLGGRLLVPLTVTKESEGSGGGLVLKVTRQQTGFRARFISQVGIFSCAGGRDPELNQRLKDAFNREDGKTVRSLRRDVHDPTDTCWLHHGGFCLSKLAVPSGSELKT